MATAPFSGTVTTVDLVHTLANIADEITENESSILYMTKENIAWSLWCDTFLNKLVVLHPHAARHWKLFEKQMYNDFFLPDYVSMQSTMDRLFTIDWLLEKFNNDQL